MLELGALTATIGERLCTDFSFLVPEGEDCFRSEGQLEPGFFWLGAAVGLWLLANLFAFFTDCSDASSTVATSASAAGWSGKQREYEEDAARHSLPSPLWQARAGEERRQPLMNG